MKKYFALAFALGGGIFASYAIAGEGNGQEYHPTTQHDTTTACQYHCDETTTTTHTETNCEFHCDTTTTVPHETVPTVTEHETTTVHDTTTVVQDHTNVVTQTITNVTPAVTITNSVTTPGKTKIVVKIKNHTKVKIKYKTRKFTPKQQCLAGKANGARWNDKLKRCEFFGQG